MRQNHPDLQELERLISESRLLGPVILLGGLECQQNLHGVMDRCELSAISQGALASGPKHTFCSGNVRTTVDYIMMGC